VSNPNPLIKLPESASSFKAGNCHAQSRQLPIASKSSRALYEHRTSLPLTFELIRRSALPNICVSCYDTIAPNITNCSVSAFSVTMPRLAVPAALLQAATRPCAAAAASSSSSSSCARAIRYGLSSLSLRLPTLCGVLIWGQVILQPTLPPTDPLRPENNSVQSTADTTPLPLRTAAYNYLNNGRARRCGSEDSDIGAPKFRRDAGQMRTAADHVRRHETDPETPSRVPEPRQDQERTQDISETEG
jgi:hypothetical protein